MSGPLGNAFVPTARKPTTVLSYPTWTPPSKTEGAAAWTPPPHVPKIPPPPPALPPPPPPKVSYLTALEAQEHTQNLLQQAEERKRKTTEEEKEEREQGQRHHGPPNKKRKHTRHDKKKQVTAPAAVEVGPVFPPRHYLAPLQVEVDVRDPSTPRNPVECAVETRSEKEGGAAVVRHQMTITTRLNASRMELLLLDLVQLPPMWACPLTCTYEFRHHDGNTVSVTPYFYACTVKITCEIDFQGFPVMRVKWLHAKHAEGLAPIIPFLNDHQRTGLVRGPMTPGPGGGTMCVPVNFSLDVPCKLIT